MLAAWAASARPDAAAAPHADGPASSAAGPASASAAGDRGSHRRDRRRRVGRRGHPDVLTPNTGSPDGATSEDGAPDTGPTGAGRDRRRLRAPPDLDPPTVRLTVRAVPRRAFGNPGAASLVARAGSADHGRSASRPTVRRRRICGHRGRLVRHPALPRPHAAPAHPAPRAGPSPGHPLRRAAVAVVVAALGVSGAAASGGTALPGDPAWAITKVFFADRAESIEAAQVVSAGLERAQLALSQRQPDLAKHVLAAVAASLPSVREEEGHTRLVDQQRMLQAVVALTPPLPGDPNLTTTTTPSRQTDPDTSVLAQGAPSAAGTEKADTEKAHRRSSPSPQTRLMRCHRHDGTPTDGAARRSAAPTRPAHTGADTGTSRPAPAPARHGSRDNGAETTARGLDRQPTRPAPAADRHRRGPAPRPAPRPHRHAAPTRHRTRRQRHRHPPRPTPARSPGVHRARPRLRRRPQRRTPGAPARTTPPRTGPRTTDAGPPRPQHRPPDDDGPGDRRPGPCDASHSGRAGTRHRPGRPRAGPADGPAPARQPGRRRREPVSGRRGRTGGVGGGLRARGPGRRGGPR